MTKADEKNRRAVVLLSGGIDSATVLAMVKNRGFIPHALSVDYGQRHRQELDAADRVARSLGTVQHRVIRIDWPSAQGSALLNAVPVPKDNPEEEIGRTIPVTYVPARNTVLLSLALAWAETIDARDIFIGVNALDYSGYPDCRPDFIEAFEKTANCGTKSGVEGQRIRIHAPLIRMTKADIIRTGASLGVNYGLTLSCYDPSPDGRSCGSCDSCSLRKKGFREAGIPDPTPYACS